MWFGVFLNQHYSLEICFQKRLSFWRWYSNSLARMSVFQWNRTSSNFRYFIDHLRMKIGERATIFFVGEEKFLILISWGCYIPLNCLFKMKGNNAIRYTLLGLLTNTLSTAVCFFFFPWEIKGCKRKKGKQTNISCKRDAKSSDQLENWLSGNLWFFINFSVKTLQDYFPNILGKTSSTKCFVSLGFFFLFLCSSTNNS